MAEMKEVTKSFTNPLTGEIYNLDDYLVSFVDEYTGEVDESRKVLDKRIRKQWAVAHYNGQLRIKKGIKIYSALDKLTSSGQSFTADDIERLSKIGREAIAHVELYIGDVFVGEDYAKRKIDAEENFEFYTEAALNAALDRALIDRGFVISGEYVKSPLPGTTHPTGTQAQGKPSVESKKKMAAPPAQSPLAGLEALIDDSAQATLNQAPVVTFDKGTPVEQIMKAMNPADARAYVITINGKNKGKTVGELYEATKDNYGHSKSLEWYAENITNDNIFVAACRLINK